MKRNSLLLLLLLLLFSSCQSGSSDNKQSASEYEDPAHHIYPIKRIFDAHGGYEQWSKMKTLKYVFNGEKTTVDLQNRYTLIEGEDRTVGYDGDKVWVLPANEDADRERWRYNLMFYFFAFPFVVGDPGVYYEEIDQIELDGKIYAAVKVSYEEGVGDSPKDNYIILADGYSGQMEYLLYTATFGGAESKDTYSLIQYKDWIDVNGVKLPTLLQWYQYEDGKKGVPRGKARAFYDIILDEAYPAPEIFQIRDGAAVAANPQ